MPDKTPWFMSQFSGIWKTILKIRDMGFVHNSLIYLTHVEIAKQATVCDIQLVLQEGIFHIYCCGQFQAAETVNSKLKHQLYQLQLKHISCNIVAETVAQKLLRLKILIGLSHIHAYLELSFMISSSRNLTLPHQ